MTSSRFDGVRLGLLLCFLIILFGLTMGIGFGVAEDQFKDWIKEGVAAHQQLHDHNSAGKIWRYAQRAHFHALGLGALTMALIVLVAISDMKKTYKTVSSTLLGLGGVYALTWLSMFLLSPSLGRGGAHEALPTILTTYIGVSSLLAGIALLLAHILFGFGNDPEA